MEGKLIVPRRWSKGRWQSEIRLLLDKKEKYRYNTRVESVYVTEDLKCLVTTAKPIPHDNPYHRIEFQTEEHQVEYEVVPMKCNAVMEG
jgi:hypothetical protein